MRWQEKHKIMDSSPDSLKKQNFTLESWFSWSISSICHLWPIYVPSKTSLCNATDSMFLTLDSSRLQHWGRQTIPKHPTAHSPPSEWDLPQVLNFYLKSVSLENNFYELLNIITPCPKSWSHPCSGASFWVGKDSKSQAFHRICMLKRKGLVYSPTSCTHISQNTCWRHRVIIWITSAF